MLEQLHRLAGQKETFAFETTLASRTFAPFLKNLKADGYTVSLLFLYLESPELAIKRVAERISSGGHAIPEADIQRRYSSGLKTFFRLYRPILDNWAI